MKIILNKDPIEVTEDDMVVFKGMVLDSADLREAVEKQKGTGVPLMMMVEDNVEVYVIRNWMNVPIMPALNQKEEEKKNGRRIS